MYYVTFKQVGRNMKKTTLMNLFKVLMLAPCLVFLVNCSKSSKSNNNNCTYQNGYYYQNGQQVSYCQSNGYNNGGYGGGYIQNGQCYMNGQIVSMQYCQTNGGYYGGQTQVCHGYYMYQGYWVTCDSTTRNCAGATLQNQYGQTVYCQ